MKDNIIVINLLERIRLVKVFSLDYYYYLWRLMEEMPLRNLGVNYVMRARY